MRIMLKLYATLTDCLPPAARRGNALPLEVDGDATVAGVIAAFQVPARLAHLVLVNGVFVPPEARATRTLCDGDVLAVWPPIAGG